MSRTNRPFADEVQRLLKDRGMSLRALARAADVSPSFLSRVLTGSGGKVPSPRLIESVAKAFELSPSHFAEYRALQVVERVQAHAKLRDEIFDSLGQTPRRRP